MAYSEEEDVYEACGMNSGIVKKFSGKDEADIEKLINGYIAKADQKIRRALGVPITIRKELHKFYRNKTIELGPHEDDLEFFGSWDPADCVEKVFAIYRSLGRVKLPYPRNCEDLSDDITHIDSSQPNVAVTKETSIVKSGDASIKAVFTGGAGDYFTMYKGANSEKFNKIIYPWKYLAFWFRTNDKTVTFTIRLWDVDGKYEYQTFTVDLADTWVIVALEITDFSTGTASIDWQSQSLQYITIHADGDCTIQIDNFNFNDGYFWTTPEGLICWSDPDATPWGVIEVTYSYDPYKNTVPEDLKEASAKFAGVLLLDYLLGCRQRITGFQHMQDDIDNRPDRETIEVTRARLQREAQSCLMGIGYKTYSGMGAA